jgi:hypothetical protein
VGSTKHSTVLTYIAHLVYFTQEEDSFGKKTFNDFSDCTFSEMSDTQKN